jgi:hypothetical protein
LQEATTAIMGRLSQRVKRLGEQEERIRAALLAALEVANLKKLETPLGTVSRRAVAPSLVVTNEAEIPEQFWDPQPPKLNRAILKGVLVAGVDVPGASLSNGGTTIAIKLT